MSYLAKLKREISQNAGRGELTELTKGASVGFVSTERGASGDISKSATAQWREFERLLSIVAPLFDTPAHEYAEISEAARGDLDAAVTTYRIMAKQLQGI